MTEKLTQIIKNQKLVFWLLASLVLFVFFLYLFFINQTVVNVAERGSIERELSELNARITGLEFEYINLKNNIDIELAHALGFQVASEPQFITSRPIGQATFPTSVQ